MPYKDPEVRRLKARFYSKRWRAAHREQVRERGRDAFRRRGHLWKRRSKEEIAAYARAYRIKVFLKEQARQAVKEALRDGLVTRPDICSECGKKCKPQAHHSKGYQKEFWLDVQWLCVRCHHDIHVLSRLRGIKE